MWIMNSRIMVHDMKDLGDSSYLWIYTLQSYTHLLESWSKLLEVVQDFSKGLKMTFLERSKGFSKLKSQLYLEFELWIQGYDNFRNDFRCL